MSVELQKASFSKRIAAALLDLILLAILVTGIALVFTMVTGYDNYRLDAQARQQHFEQEYGVKFDITAEDYAKLTEEERQRIDTAYSAMCKDETFLYNFNMMINLILLIVSGSLLISIVITDFVIPLLLKNGQTLGKKVFGIGVIRTDGVQLTTLQLFVRTILGKFTIELMIPVYIIIMLFFGTANLISLTILVGIAIIQLICVIATRTNSAIHDLMAGTVAVDLASQQIFRNTEDLLAYTKKIHAERADRSAY